MNSKSEVIVRTETITDHKDVFDLIEKAFQQEEISDHREQFLVERLRKGDSFVSELSLVALEGNKVVGFILFTEVKLEDGDHEHTILALAPVAVLPEYQGQGIGGSLIKAGHQRAKKLNYKGVVLLGHADYYPKFGYRMAHEFGIKLPFDVPKENCMVYALSANSLDQIKGMVVYPKAFYE